MLAISINDLLGAGCKFINSRRVLIYIYAWIYFMCKDQGSSTGIDTVVGRSNIFCISKGKDSTTCVGRALGCVAEKLGSAIKASFICSTDCANNGGAANSNAIAQTMPFPNPQSFRFILSPHTRKPFQPRDKSSL